MKNIVELLKSNKYQISKELLFNYRKLNITDSEFIILIYLLNQEEKNYNPKQISKDLNIPLNEILELINSLTEKNIINIEMKKINNIRTEIINIDLLFEKLALNLDDNVEVKDDNIYSLFEKEFGRTLSPIEYEIIGAWVDNGYTEEIIKLALKEAVYNGVSNLRYIDKIIYEWNKKGIKNKEDVEKDRKNFKNKNNKKEEIFTYDWLNEDKDN